MTLGTRLIKLRGNLSQKEVAQNLDVSQPTYSSWEAGACKPHIENLMKISQYFGIGIDELLDDNEKIGVLNHNNVNNGGNNFNNIVNIQQSPELMELVQKQTEQITKATELITKTLETQFRIAELLNKKN